MTQPDVTLRVNRADSEKLVLDGLGLARAFFVGDLSSRPGGYDSLAGSGDCNRIVIEDVVAVNTTMRARSRHDAWRHVLDSDQAWLRAIPSDLDIVQASEEEWAALNGDALLSRAISACINPGIALASATKVLHLKRPYLVPILDRLVGEMMGVNLSGNTSTAERIEVGRRLTSAIRREGRRNIQVLQYIQSQLANEGIDRTLIRIFGAVLWYSHPAAGVSGGQRTITMSIRT